jgi:hypothetical protein
VPRQLAYRLGATKMIGKRLTRRVEDLESHLLTVVGEPLVVRLNFVDTDETIADHRDFTLNAPAPRDPTARPWRRK